MRDDFCTFILTHGRPDRVYTYDTLKKAGYTGKLYLVIDDEDPTGDEYRRRYGEQVLTFSKVEIAKTFDEGDNLPGRRGVIYARNACWDLARQVGCRYFWQLDDDYKSFHLRFNSALRYGATPPMRRVFDLVLEALLDFYASTPALTVALSQGGEHIGGGMQGRRRPYLLRKAMNTFLCTTDRLFRFVGRINEDTNAYASLGRQGALFLTVFQAQVNQLMTQTNAGGMTSLYLDSGTYVKSFYSVMYAPSCVKIGEIGDHRSPHYRMHHAINWHKAVPVILRETHRKASRQRPAAV